MISITDYEIICYENDRCHCCKFFMDCTEAKNIKNGAMVKGSENRYESLLKYWRKQKLAKLLEK